MVPLKTTVTFLHMYARSERRAPAPTGRRLLLTRAERPPVGFYRYLYESVGKPWVWVNRRRMSDADLTAAIHQPGVEVYVLYADGCPAGYAELDARNPDASDASCRAATRSPSPQLIRKLAWLV